MKKRVVLAVVSAAILIASSAFSVENEGFIQKLKNRFKAKEDVAAQAIKKEQAAVKPAPMIAKPAAEAPKSVDKMTKEEIADRIAKALDRREEVLNFVQDLKKEKGPDGNVFYTFQGVKITDLDRGLLEKLYVRVRQEVVRINTERLTKQIESINRANQLSRVAQQPPQVPSVPRVITAPPRLPALPPVVQQTPQIPKNPPTPPPAPPRR